MTPPPSHPSVVPALALALAPAYAADDAEEGPRPQQCGRCRQFFDGDETLNAAAQPEWWLCAACRMRLLPSQTT